MERNKEKVETRKPKESIATLTIRLLENLLDAVDGIAMHNISRHQAYGAFKKAIPGCGNSRSARILQSLKARGYVSTFRGKDGICSIELTGKAKMKLVDNITSRMKLSKSFYFMSFDIPESMRTKRNKFRILMKRMGFVQIQQSLWVINKEVGELVQIAAYECGVEKYVVYIVSAMSDIDVLLAKKFDENNL